MKRSGFADLPLHGGRVPPWLSERMTKLGSAIAENIVYNYGTAELLSRLRRPGGRNRDFTVKQDCGGRSVLRAAAIIREAIDGATSGHGIRLVCDLRATQEYTVAVEGD